jgi:hypothetical protein
MHRCAPDNPNQERAMEWELIKDDVAQFGQRVKEKWHDLTDDDMSHLWRGDLGHFVTAVGERYGLSSTSIHRELEAIARSMSGQRSLREDKKNQAQPQEGRARARGAEQKAAKKDQPQPR